MPDFLAVPFALSLPSAVMLAVIGGIGAATLRFSMRYLNGARNIASFKRWFLATLVGAAIVVTARDLIVLALGWTLTSLSLHQLLTFGPPRAGAEVAAHKKYLLSRLADVSMIVAVILLARAYGTTALGPILEMARDGVLPSGAAWGATFLALTIVMRSAQLPFHGWLIQVMEAPTPVSAVLHAGVVNLGAYVAITLAPLFVLTPVALMMLFGFGLLSATLASLSSLAQPSIKGSLAWSTCAQMGFVLVEIGVGAYDLAILHIAGHAAYKAYAFLSSGSVVASAAARRAPAGAPTLGRWIVSAIIATGAILLAAPLGRNVTEDAAALFGTALLILAITPALALTSLRGGLRANAAALATIVALPLLYAAWHGLLAPMMPLVPTSLIASTAVWSAVAAFTLLLAVYATVTTDANSRLARALYPHAVLGFHLDAIFTRLTFRLWPPTVTEAALRRPRQPEQMRLERAA